MTDFAAVDAGDAQEHVEMMDATDAWPAVRAGRAWVLAEVGPHAGALVLDAGCGPGTFGRSSGAVAVDVDTSWVMLDECRRRHPDALAVLADAASLPVPTGAADLVRAERVLQWTEQPEAVLSELWRATRPGGHLAVTDTDWGTLLVEHPDPDITNRFAAAARAWVPHPLLARTLPDALVRIGGDDVRRRTDTVTLTGWDADEPGQRSGPPGLPLRAIAARGAPDDRALDAVFDELVDRARGGGFRATLDLVTVLARRPEERP